MRHAAPREDSGSGGSKAAAPVATVPAIHPYDPRPEIEDLKKRLNALELKPAIRGSIGLTGPIGPKGERGERGARGKLGIFGGESD